MIANVTDGILRLAINASARATHLGVRPRSISRSKCRLQKPPEGPGRPRRLNWGYPGNRATISSVTAQSFAAVAASVPSGRGSATLQSTQYLPVIAAAAGCAAT